jgi:hypothetical protein
MTSYEISKAVTQIVAYLALAALVWWRASKRGWRGWFWALFFLIIPPLALCFYWLIALRENRRRKEGALATSGLSNDLLGAK